MDLLDKLIMPLLGALGGGCAAYVAIRADLAALKAQMAIFSQSLSRAHERIDSILSSRK